MGHRRWIRFAAVSVLVLAIPLAARGHATLVETDPVDGSQLEQPPGKVIVTFSEPVDVPEAAIRVFDDTGSRVDAGNSTQGPSPEQIQVPLPKEMETGTYVVTWGVVSVDGHPIRSAFTFQVGDASVPADDSLVASLLGDRAGGIYAVTGAVARWVTYLAGLAAAGAAMFFSLVARRQAVPPSVGRFARAAALTAMAGSILQVPLFAGEVSGVFTFAGLVDAVTSPVGLSGLVRIVSLAVIASAITNAPSPSWRWPGVAGVVAAELLAGHTLTTQPAWLVLGADAIHVLASAVWIGGLGAVFLVIRDSRDAESAAGWIAHFSRLAVVSVIALSIGGLALAWAEVRTLGALTSTAYGWTLLFKVGLAAAVIATGGYNNRFLVPAVRRAAEESAPVAVSSVSTLTKPDRAAFAKLRRTVGWEIGGLAAVLAVTALLVNLQPAAEAAGVTGPFSTYVEFGDGQLNLVVDPNQVGTNQIHVYVLTAGGSPAPAEGEAVLELSLPAQDIGPFVVEPHPAGPGHWIHTGPELAIPGSWEITFRLASGFGESSATTKVEVTT